MWVLSARITSPVKHHTSKEPQEFPFATNMHVPQRQTYQSPSRVPLSAPSAPTSWDCGVCGFSPCSSPSVLRRGRGRHVLWPPSQSPRGEDVDSPAAGGEICLLRLPGSWQVGVSSWPGWHPLADRLVMAKARAREPAQPQIETHAPSPSC